MPRRLILSEEFKQNVLEYYKTHTLTNTAKYFKLQNYKVKEILDEYNISEHSIEYSKKLRLSLLEQNNLDRYGVKNVFQTDFVKSKSKQTCLIKYGTEYVSSSKEFRTQVKTTVQAKYGVQNISQVSDIKKKKSSTCYNHFRVYNNLDIPGARHQQWYYSNDIVFDSFPELCFYLYYRADDIFIEREPETFKFYLNNTEYHYTPDFRVEEKLVELKGGHLVNSAGFWINPFTNSEQAQEIAKARQKCAIANGVKILYESDYKKYIRWFYKNGYKKETFKKS